MVIIIIKWNVWEKQLLECKLSYEAYVEWTTIVIAQDCLWVFVQTANVVGLLRTLSLFSNYATNL